ncbi:hypothetical protein ACFV1F_18205 [Streptomyces sp. NPDC059590]|uniref:hypothetical protein n=1 Tax=Streptomyces sp. NPDC059590 TaxID=3346877 RepID=UPI0036A1049E
MAAPPHRAAAPRRRTAPPIRVSAAGTRHVLVTVTPPSRSVGDLREPTSASAALKAKKATATTQHSTESPIAPPASRQQASAYQPTSTSVVMAARTPARPRPGRPLSRRRTTHRAVSACPGVRPITPSEREW